MKKGNPLLRIFGERRGSSTLEYVIVIAAGALFASLLFWAIQSQEDVLREKVAAVLKGELLQVQPSGEAEDAEVEPSGAGIHRPQIPVNPAETISSSPPPPNPGSGWADKAKEVPVLGWVVEKTEPLFDRYLKPFGESTGLGPIVGEVADFFDPTPALYELATGKDWETGEELGAYDHYVEPFLEYLIAKKVGRGGELLAKADKKLTGGKITHQLEEWTQPVKDKRDQFVEWACSRGGWFSERAVPTAYADPGGSKPDKDCLMQQVLGWSGKEKKINSNSGRYNNQYKRDYQTKNTKQFSATFSSEGEARAVAREKLGKNPVYIGDNKYRSRDGKWQYRAKPVDTNNNHIHLERIDPETGEVLENWHLYWPEGGSR